MCLAGSAIFRAEDEGGGGDGGSGEPEPFEFQRVESYLELSLEAPNGATDLLPGTTRPLVAAVNRIAWEIWQRPSTGESEIRNSSVTPEPGVAVSFAVTVGEGSLSMDSVTTGESGEGAIVFTAGWAPQSATVTATMAAGSTASLTFDPPGEAWAYHHSEATLTATLGSSISPAEVPTGEARDLVATVSYVTWDVMESNYGNQRVENISTSPADGAQVTWSVASGDGYVTGAGTAGADGVSLGSLTMGSVDSVARVDVAYATGQATSAQLLFTTAPPAPDPAETWTLDRTEMEPVMTFLWAEGGPQQPAGTAVAVTGSAQIDRWDVWVNGLGQEDRRYNFSLPLAYRSVAFTVESGDGSLSSSSVSTDGTGSFSVTYYLGSAPSRLAVAVDADPDSTVDATGALDFTIASPTGGGGGDPGNGGGDGSGDGSSNPPPWSLLRTEGEYTISGLSVDGPTYDVEAGATRTISGTVSWTSWEVWTDAYGTTEIRNATTVPVDGQWVNFAIESGDGSLGATMAWSGNGTGSFSVPFTMGTQASRVRAWLAAGATGTEPSASVELTPPTIVTPEEEWTKIRDEATISVSFQQPSNLEQETGTSVYLEVQVTKTTWELWESNLGATRIENEATGPAIGAEVTWSLSQGDAQISEPWTTSLTDADGKASRTLTMGSTTSVVGAGATFQAAAASAEIEITPAQAPLNWQIVGQESELQVILDEYPGEPRRVQATVRVLERQLLEAFDAQGTLHTAVGEQTDSPAEGASVTFWSDTGGSVALIGDSLVYTGTDGTAGVDFTVTGTGTVHASVSYATFNPVEASRPVGEGGSIPGGGSTPGGGSGNNGGGGTSGNGGNPPSQPSQQATISVKIGEFRWRWAQAFWGAPQPSMLGSYFSDQGLKAISGGPMMSAGRNDPGTFPAAAVGAGSFLPFNGYIGVVGVKFHYQDEYTSDFPAQGEAVDIQLVKTENVGGDGNIDLPIQWQRFAIGGEGLLDSKNVVARFQVTGDLPIGTQIPVAIYDPVSELPFPSPGSFGIHIINGNTVRLIPNVSTSRYEIFSVLHAAAIIDIPLGETEITFGGPNHTLRSDDGTITYSAPHWVDKNGDGVASREGSEEDGTLGERNFPIAYTRKAKPVVAGAFKLPGMASGEIIKIRAKWESEIVLEETEITVNNESKAVYPAKEFLVELPDVIQFYDADRSIAFKLNWEYLTPNNQWDSLITTNHTLYVTRADPIGTAAGLMREALFNLGCRNARGKGAAKGKGEAEQEQEVVDAIYADFRDRDVQRVKPSSGTLDGVKMTYWGNPNEQRHATVDLLSSGDGKCGAWTRLFTDVLRTQGIDSEVIGFYAPMPNLQTLGPAIQAKYPNYQGQIIVVSGNPPQPKPLILVKNWNLGNQFAPIDNHGIEAQGSPDPQAFFGDHAVVEYGGKYYDPSYGSNVFASQQEWEDAVLDAFGFLIFGNPSLPDQAQTNPALPQGVTIWMWQADPKGSVETIPQNAGY